MILITGITGFVGQQLSCELVRRGREVRGARRSCFSAVPDEIEPVLVSSLGPNTDWATALSGVDTVIHLAARVHLMNETEANPLDEFRKVNVEGSKKLAQQAAQLGVRRFIFISSIKVNGEFTVSTPFSDDVEVSPLDAYGLSKWEAEEALRKIAQVSRMEVVILRPPLIYGPGVKANLHKLIQVIDKGLPLPLMCVRNSRSLIGLSNFVDLIIHCVDAPQAAGKTFMVSDGDDVSTPELVRRIAIALNKKALLLPIPQFLINVAALCTGKRAQIQRLCSSLQVDSSKLKSELGWHAPYSMAEELERVITAYRKSN